MYKFLNLTFSFLFIYCQKWCCLWFEMFYFNVTYCIHSLPDLHRVVCCSCEYFSLEDNNTENTLLVALKNLNGLKCFQVPHSDSLVIRGREKSPSSSVR
eukprot:m.165597 g.165597  ORF g.165597 m.165597 type:complete len:99 (-) comp13438_c0_seq16:1821-2117(-)